MKATIRICCVFLCLILCTALPAQEKQVPKEMLGKWLCKVENPQTGETMKGNCVIAQKNTGVKASFTMGNGESETTDFRPNENGKCYADITIQDYQLGISFAMVEGKLICEMDVDSYVIPIEMSKE